MFSPSSLKKTEAKYLEEIILVFVLSTLTAIGLFAVDLLFPPELIESLGNRDIAQIMLVLILVVLALTALIIYLRFPLLTYVPTIGAYFHNKTGIYYCAKCKLNKRINSPMQIAEENKGWRCSACHSFKSNPDYISHQIHRLVEAQDG